MRSTGVEELPHALEALEPGGELRERLSGRRPAVFLDYDGTLTPIVDRPEDAVISDEMREAVRGLARRCTVCVVSGRDRYVVQELMGLDDLVVAGSHGFDIWSPTEGEVRHEASGRFEELVTEVEERLRRALAGIEGALVEPKSTSVAAHYRLVAEEERVRVGEVVEALLAERPDELKVTPGKMVYEVQPKIDWDKGRAVLYLLETLGLNREDTLPIYLGDDVTDEDAFGALSGRGVGVFVGDVGHPETAGRDTVADYALYTFEEVRRFMQAMEEFAR